MIYCINCGEKISEFQFNNFYKLCPACVRIKQLQLISNENLSLNVLKNHVNRELKEIENELVYVLRLENNKWWIGKTKNLNKKLSELKRGKGSEWIRENKIISAEKVIKRGNLTFVTLDYIKEYGHENVRGTCWHDGPQAYIPKKIKELVAEQKKTKVINGDYNSEIIIKSYNNNMGVFIQGDRVKIRKKGYEGKLGKIIGYDGIMYYEIELLEIKKTIKCLENEIEKASESDIKELEFSFLTSDGTLVKLKTQNLKPNIESLKDKNNFIGIFALGRYYPANKFPKLHKNDYITNKVLELKESNPQAASEIASIFINLIENSKELILIINKVDCFVMMPTTKESNHIKQWGNKLNNRYKKQDITDFVIVTKERKPFFDYYKFKNARDREKIVTGAFEINSSARNFPNLNEKTCLILDDVCTTGNQINELTNLLVQEGVKDVYALVIARTKSDVYIT